MIFIVIIVLLIISILISLWSLKNIEKMHEVTKAKEDLSKSKILFQHDLSTSQKHEEGSSS